MDSNRNRLSESMITSEEGKSQGEKEEKKEIFFYLLSKVGTMGRYQITLFITLCFIGIFDGVALLITPFLFYQGDYICDSSLSQKQCLDYVCSLPETQRSAFIPSDPLIHSFANQFGDYRCPSQESTLNAIKTLFYSGQLIGCFISALVGDILRSKVIMVGGMAISLIGSVMIALSDILWLCVVGMVLFTIGINQSFNLSYIFLTEFVQEDRRQYFKVVLASMFSIGALVDVLFFFILPNYVLVMLIFFALPVLILIIIFMLFFKDTPISLITKNSQEKAFKNFVFIAKANGIKQPDLTLQDIKHTKKRYETQILKKNQNQSRKFTILDLFKFKSLRMMTIILIFVDIIFYLQYLTPTLMLAQFNFNIFVNGASIQSAQLLVGVIGVLTIYRLKRRWVAIVSFGIIMACSIVLIFVWDQNAKQASNGAVVLIFLFFIELVVSNAFNFYAIYLNQLYPNQIRIVAIGFIKTFGSTTPMFSSFIIDACINSGFPIMLLFAILAAVSIVLSWILPETHGKRPPEVIEEMQEYQPVGDKCQLELPEDKKSLC